MLLEHPQVKEVCVYGIPDEKYGEEITALVVGNGKEVSGDELINKL